MKIGIIGTGAYAIAIASILEKKELEILMWTKIESEYQELITNHQNSKVIDYKLNNKVKYTKDLKEITQDTNIIILALPTLYVKETLEILKPYWQDQILLIATKGMLEDTLIHEYIKNELQIKKIVCMSGPTFAKDIIKEKSIGFTIASQELANIQEIQSLFKNISYIKTDTTRDIIGVELCGILKNIVAIASGILYGMNLSPSTISRFLVDISTEMQNIIEKLNGQRETFLTYAGLGDFFLTNTNKESRNFTFGKLIGENQNTELYKQNTTLEGYENLKHFYFFLKKKNIDSSIIDILYKIVYESKPNELLLEYFLND